MTSGEIPSFENLGYIKTQDFELISSPRRTWLKWKNSWSRDLHQNLLINNSICSHIVWGILKLDRDSLYHSFDQNLLACLWQRLRSFHPLSFLHTRSWTILNTCFFDLLKKEKWEVPVVILIHCLNTHSIYSEFGFESAYVNIVRKSD